MVYSVEAEFIERVVAEYGPCMFFHFWVRLQFIYGGLLYSYQGWGDRRRPNVGQGAGERSIREVPAIRYLHSLVPLAAWTNCLPSRPAARKLPFCRRGALLTIAQILIQHRAPDWALQLVENILRPLGSRYVYLSYEDHDLITANTQAVTHAAFLRSVDTDYHHYACS